MGFLRKSVRRCGEPGRLFGKGGKGTGFCEREADQGKAPSAALKGSLAHISQEAEQATYATTQIATGQIATDTPTQAVQPAASATGIADASAMDVDEDAAAHGTVGEGQGGVKRKAGEDVELTSKKLKMGMFMTVSRALVADTAIAYRTCRCSSEEVRPTSAPLILPLLTSDCRDRENCTVFVSDLPESTAEDDLKALFKDVSPRPHHVWKPNCSQTCSLPSAARSKRLR